MERETRKIQLMANFMDIAFVMAEGLIPATTLGSWLNKLESDDLKLLLVGIAEQRDVRAERSAHRTPAMQAAA